MISISLETLQFLWSFIGGKEKKSPLLNITLGAAKGTSMERGRGGSGFCQVGGGNLLKKYGYPETQTYRRLISYNVAKTQLVIKPANTIFDPNQSISATVYSFSYKDISYLSTLPAEYLLCWVTTQCCLGWKYGWHWGRCALPLARFWLNQKLDYKKHTH